MPGPKAESVELTEKQRHLLQQVIRREKSMQQSVRYLASRFWPLPFSVQSSPGPREKGADYT